MFDYFTHDKGLNNLLWVYCPAGETDPWNPVDSMWPGDSYVDIVGLDVYDDTLEMPGQPYQRLMQKGKPIGFFKTGPGTWHDVGD
jgi:mannan endo-1,4-beta-mannosidase